MATTPNAAIPDPEEVLEHLDWVRRLAEKLVGDPAEAEDLRQEVWLLSQRLQRPSRIPLRGWLSGLVANLARTRRRAARTRAYHEETSALQRARSMSEPAAVREVALHQVVVERLVRMRDPYRSTLLACYFEGLSPMEVAEREGVALATVRSRIQRGLRELRADLASERKRGVSVLALLAERTWDPARYRGPVVPVAEASSAWVLPLVVVGAGTALTAALVLGGDGAVSPSATRVAAEDAAPQETANTRASATRTPAPTVREDALGEAGETAASEDEVAAVAVTPASAAPTVRAVDLTGAPVPGIEVAFKEALESGGFERGPIARTDAEGRATLEGVRGRGMVVAGSAAHSQLAFPNAGADSIAGEELVIVLAPALDVSGRVTDPDGVPVPGAEVRLGFLAPLPPPVARYAARANAPAFDATTDADGGFAVRLARSSVPMGLMVQAVGYEPVVRMDLVFDAPTVEPLDVVLQPVADRTVCFGKVQTSNGETIAGAWVADGERAVRTDGAGAFQLGPVPGDAALWAGAPGFAPRRVQRPDDLRNLVVELDGDPLTIEGRIVRPDGTGAAGIDLRLTGTEPAGDYYFDYGGRQAFVPVAVETFGRPLRGPAPETRAATTDADGAFVLEGLLPRDYGIECSDPRTLQRAAVQRFTAGARGVRIDFPARPAAVRGTVRTPDGSPVGSALVRTFAADLAFRQGPSLRTGADGAFAFDGLAAGTTLHVDVDFPWVHLGTIADGAAALDIVVEPAARLTLVLDLREGFAGGARVPDRAYLRDPAAERVAFVLDDVRAYRLEALDLVRGEDGYARPVPLIVPTRAHELVLADGDGPILVLPLDASPGSEVRIAE